MPEQPDVQVFKQYFDAHALHKPIDRVTVQVPRIIEGTTERTLQHKLVHHRFERSNRHGKYLLSELDTGGWLVFHFGMTGRFEEFKRGDQPPRYSAVTFEFGEEALAYTSRRKLGHIWLVEDGIDSFLREKELGIDIMDPALTEKRFAAMAREQRGAVKCWLMDQSKLAGLGNVYSDEVLYQAGIHPKRLAAELDDKTLQRLYRTIHQVLPRAIAAEADPNRVPESWLLRDRKKGAACPGRCGGKIHAIALCGRTGYFCPTCQR